MLSKEDLKRFIDECKVNLTGASEGGIKLEFYSVAGEFFRDTNAWTETITLPITIGVQDYRLVPRHGGEIIKLWAITDPNGFPVAGIMPEFSMLHLSHAPQNTTNVGPLSYNVYVVKTITGQSEDGIPLVPHWLLSVYRTTMIDGVLGRLMAQENKSYSNAQMAQYHLKRFTKGIDDAKVAAQRQNSMGVQNWRYPGGWRASTQRLGWAGWGMRWPPGTNEA